MRLNVSTRNSGSIWDLDSSTGSISAVWTSGSSIIQGLGSVLRVSSRVFRLQFAFNARNLGRMNQWVAFLLILIAGCQSGVAVNVLVGTNPNLVLEVNQYLNQSGYYLLMQPDCNLVLFNSSFQPVLDTHSSRQNENCSLVMQDDGNLVIYNYTGSSWETRTNVPFPIWAQNYFSPDGNQSFLLLGANGTLEYYTTNSTLRPNSVFNGYASTGTNYEKFNPSSTVYTAWTPDASLKDFPYMPAGYFLDAGKRLLAKSEVFSLALGNDCNLESKQVKYDGGVKVLWNSSTGSAENRSCRLSVNLDGRLVLSNQATGSVYWNSSEVGSTSVSWILKLDPDDGTLRVSDITNTTNVLWTNLDRSLPPDDTVPSSSKQSVVWIVVGVLGGVLVLAVAASGLYFYARHKYRDPAEKAFQLKLRATGGNSQAYSETKIKQATKNYENVIGRGGFGDVYYGKLSDGQEVAAKVLSAQSHQSKQEFFNEIELLSKVHHRYLVSLLGYSCTRRHSILIYEYMGGGDLRHRLQGETGAANSLSWQQRTSIILQVAEGLEYLHDKCSPPVIHRDIKSTNILLTNKLVAKVADFGLSKLKTIGQEEATHISTVVKGTPGYLDPEYHETGQLTEKSDVYAFGVVLMEILTGRHPMHIAQRVGEAWRQERFDNLADPNLGDDFDRQQLVSLVELALWCVRRSNMERPFMRQIVGRLHDIGLASSEPHQPEIALGEEQEEEEETQRNAMDVELYVLDSETTPLSGSKSSSAMSFEPSGGHPVHQLSR